MKSSRRRLWEKKPLKSSYDAVIVGGGLHGLAAAYFLARRHGMTDIAVIEKRYIGFGGSGRNGGIVRANQRTQENLVLYQEGLALWPQLTRELDFNLMFYNCGNLNLAHSDRALAAMRLHVASAQFSGVDIHMVDAKQCKELVPELDIWISRRMAGYRSKAKSLPAVTWTPGPIIPPRPRRDMSSMSPNPWDD